VVVHFLVVARQTEGTLPQRHKGTKKHKTSAQFFRKSV
jgi:hypothetical protein